MIKISEYYEITYIAYSKENTGVILSLDRLLDAEEITDDDWNFLDDYSDCVFVASVNGEACDTPTAVRRDDISAICREDGRSRTGYVIASEQGDGYDCVEPDAQADDGTMLYLSNNAYKELCKK